MSKAIHYGFLSATALSGAIFLGHLSTYAAFTGGVSVMLGAVYVAIAIFGFWCVAFVKTKRGYITQSGVFLALMPAIALGVILAICIGLGVWTGV